MHTTVPYLGTTRHAPIVCVVKHHASNLPMTHNFSRSFPFGMGLNAGLLPSSPLPVALTEQLTHAHCLFPISAFVANVVVVDADVDVNAPFFFGSVRFGSVPVVRIGVFKYIVVLLHIEDLLVYSILFLMISRMWRPLKSNTFNLPCLSGALLLYYLFQKLQRSRALAIISIKAQMAR